MFRERQIFRKRPACFCNRLAHLPGDFEIFIYGCLFSRNIFFLYDICGQIHLKIVSGEF